MNRLIAGAVLALTFAFAAGCGGGGGGGGGGGAPAGSASVTATIRDAATDGWLSFEVRVAAVDLIPEGGGAVPLFPPANQPGARLPVDLLALRGESRVVATRPVPPGRYTGFLFAYEQAQALAAGAMTAAPPGANASGTVQVDFPAPVVLVAGEAGILDIDFDLDASLAGGINGFHPVVRCDFVDGDTSPPAGWTEPVVESVTGAIVGRYPEKSSIEIAMLGGVPVPALGTWDESSPPMPGLPVPIPMGRQTVFLTDTTETILPDGSVLIGNGPDVFEALTLKTIVEVSGRLRRTLQGAIVADTITVFPVQPEPERFEICGLISGLDLASDPMTMTLLNRVSILPMAPAFELAGGAALLPPIGGSTRVILTPETKVLCDGWWETDVAEVLPLSILRIGAAVNAAGAWTPAGFTARVVRIQPQSIAGNVVVPPLNAVMPTRGLLVNVDIVEGVPVAQLPGFANPVLVIRQPVPVPLPVEPPTDPVPPETVDGTIGTGTAVIFPAPPPPIPPEPVPGVRVRAYGTFCAPGGAFEAYDVQIEWEYYRGTAVTDLSLSPPAFTLVVDNLPQIQIFPPPPLPTVRVEIHAGTRIVALGGDPCEMCLLPMEIGMERPIFVDGIQVLTPEELIALLKSGEYYSVEVEGWRTSDVPRTISAATITVRRDKPWWWDGGGITPVPMPVPEPLPLGGAVGKP
jgi:hypothetical protein